MISRVKIALLGPNRIALDGLQRILAENGFEIGHSSNDATALSEALDAQIPDPDSIWILLAYGLADAKGSYDPGELVERFPGLRCAILADVFDFDEMVKCFREGVRGYIVAASSQALVISLQLIAIGEKVMPSSLAEFLPMHPSVGPAPGKSQSIEQAGLSMRELEILACLVSGHPNKIISRQLEISEATVKVHVKAILRKIGVQNRTQAAIWAVGERLGDTPLHPAHCVKGANGVDHGSSLVN